MPAYGAGYGPGYGNPFFLPPPPIVAGPTFVVPVGNIVPVHPEAEVVKGDFRAIAPRKKDEGFIAPFVDRVAKPEKPAVRIDPFAEQRAIGLTEPALDLVQQLKLAREALAAGEYGAAAEHLDRALQAKPDDATALFLKAQAQFASGQYSEAAATIQTSLRVHPGWAKLDVKPQELFGKPARFDGLFGDLKRSLAANPDSTTLQFLVAHQLWFGGDRDAAKAAFTRLAARLNDADAVAPFLK